LKAGTFSVRQLSEGDGGPDWREYIRVELERSGGSGACLEVSWL